MIPRALVVTVVLGFAMLAAIVAFDVRIVPVSHLN